MKTSSERHFQVPDLSGKVVLVTGASSGIGRAAALRLAASGATVLVHGRSRERTVEVAQAVGAKPLIADFARLDAVSGLAGAVRQATNRLDVVLHNAGALVPRRTITPDGHELTFQGNHLAAFLLQLLLHDLIVGTPGSRVIVTSSAANNSGRVIPEDLDGEWARYRPFHIYATSKLENILFARELGRRLANTSTVAMAVHPGSVATAFGAGSVVPGVFYRIPGKRLYLLSPESGAAPLVWAATTPDVKDSSGTYFDRFKPHGKTSPQADDSSLARELWQRSVRMVDQWLDRVAGWDEIGLE
ncbi:MAG: SDR family NAD(P)-dependent oxidoreductase [Actinobacteria bacterium]|nr:SDR family NAD(P)-dependent oxidoreductase [Actinomycetota bacterium]